MSLQATDGVEIAVLVPCYNEEAAVRDVVMSFRRCLPSAKVYVYDNNSTDRTAVLAAEAGAIVRTESNQGKGHVIKRMFADVEADVYVLVDGDGTYEAEAAPRLVAELVLGPYDMINGARIHEAAAAYRPGHVLGNKLLSRLVALFFGRQVKDMLSGYKVLSRRFVKSFPVLTSGFEIETEMLVHALELRVPMTEVATAYRERIEGSHSKLSTYRDGLRILRLIAYLVKNERPLLFFGGVGALFAVISLGLGTPVVFEYVRTGLVPRFPTAILATGLMLSAGLSLFAGLILEGLVLARREAKLLRYLALPSVGVRPNARLD
jgi:glycosyltransferase involved in cell wall biosynthesis